LKEIYIAISLNLWWLWFCRFLISRTSQDQDIFPIVPVQNILTQTLCIFLFLLTYELFRSLYFDPFSPNYHCKSGYPVPSTTHGTAWVLAALKFPLPDKLICYG
jgi:hypothetical protein